MFTPTHCPNPECTHFPESSTTNWYRKITPYLTLTFGMVPRFLCKSCHMSFSSQTFSIDYYAKRKLDYLIIYKQVNSGAGLRNIARNLNRSPRTIRNRINRLSRNAILIHQALRDELPYSEDFVADGFESFCVSQYFPDNYNILVGKDSQFVYQCNYVTLRRKGRMRPDQKRQREKLEKIFKANPKAVELSFRDLMESLERMTRKRTQPLILYTDEKKDYERALWGSACCKERLFNGSWRHHRVNSEEGRNTQNPLFGANYMDREFRKDMASHTRESVQFSRNVNEAMLRMSLYLFDHNYIKPYRVAQREKRRLRHGEVAGLDRGSLDQMISGFFKSRYFWKKDHPLEGPARKTLNREWVTPLKRMPEVVRKHLTA